MVRKKKTAKKTAKPSVSVVFMAPISKTGKVGKPKAYAVMGGGGSAKAKPRKKRRRSS